MPGFQSLAPWVQTAVLGFAAIVAGTGPLLVALGSITMAVGGLATVIGAISFPVTATVLAVGGLVAAFTFFGDEIMRVVKSKMEPMLQTFDLLKAAFTDFTLEEAEAAHQARKLSYELGEVAEVAEPTGQKMEDLTAFSLGLAIELDTVTTPAVQNFGGATTTTTTQVQELTDAIDSQIDKWNKGGIPTMEDALAAYTKWGGTLKELSTQQLTALNKKLEEGIKTLVRQGKEVPIHANQLYIATLDQMNNKITSLGTNLAHLPKHFPGIEEMPLGPLHKMMEGIGGVQNEALRGPGVFSQWGTSVKAGFSNLWQGMTGGTGKISGMFKQLGTGIMDGFGQIVSGGMTTLINKGVQLGMQGLGKLGSWIQSKFGVAQAEKDARGMVQVFEQMVAQSLTQEQMAEAGGERWKQVTIGVRDAYLAAGLSVEEAMRDVENLWKATKEGPNAVQSVIDKVQELAGEFISLNALELQDKYMDIHATYKYANDRRTTAPETEGDFQSGTGGRYVDFGAGTAVTLHGRERVMTEAEGASDSAILEGIRRDLKTMPMMIRDALILAG